MQSLSLLPIVRKVLEKLSTYQLKEHLSAFSLLPPKQLAYRHVQGHSTEDAGTCVVNKLLLAQDSNQSTGLVFVNLSKAFESRWEASTTETCLVGNCMQQTVRMLNRVISYPGDRSQWVKLQSSLNKENVVSWCSPRKRPVSPSFHEKRQVNLTGKTIRQWSNLTKTMARLHSPPVWEHVEHKAAT